MSKPLGERLKQGAQAFIKIITAEPKPPERVPLRDGTFLEVTVTAPLFYGQSPKFITRTYATKEGGEPLSTAMADVPVIPTI